MMVEALWYPPLLHSLLWHVENKQVSACTGDSHLENGSPDTGL